MFKLDQAEHCLDVPFKEVDRLEATTCVALVEVKSLVLARRS